MQSTEKILEIAKIKGQVLTSEVATLLGVSRQYANTLIRNLVTNNNLVKIGSTRKACYILPELLAQHQKSYTRTLQNNGLEEHIILSDIEKKFPLSATLSENIHSIFAFAFSEMLNNAIEHSQSKLINIEVMLSGQVLSFIVNDSGIGAFRSVMQKRKLKSELEAIQEILKGKMTTTPKSHSGEGIFFTARSGDQFILDSYGYRLIYNNELPDVFLQKVKKIKKGTKVIFKINIDSKRHLTDVFNAYANIGEDSDYGFDKTEVQVKLYAVGGVCVSRSQARRILSQLHKFKIIVFDYAQVPMIGQAFADEIYRVFQNQHPGIKLENINMNETVEFMIKRAKTEAMKSSHPVS